jgi:hypothetical protein
MGNNDINKTENILVKVDDNNLVYIDPNSVLNGNKVEMRDVPAENLMVYVNLEADIVPRTTLSQSNQQDATKKVLIAETQMSNNSMNFMKNGKGGDFDTAWTDAFLVNNQYKDKSGNDSGVFYNTDSTAQSFGIDSITMSVKGYAIPQVTINFTDVRGKTLFDSPKNSPYKILFHLPWPIFYLTVKGYYGKAIKYRLHLVKFTTKYNENNGNFDITCTFVGSTYAFLADIPIAGVMNAPYMFGNEITTDNVKGVITKTVRTSKSSKGYIYLKSVYDEYKRKGYIDQNFPVKTLREVVILAKNLDATLEREILKGDLRPKIFNGLNEFGNNLTTFNEALNGWQNDYLSSTYIKNAKRGNDIYYKLKESEQNKDIHLFGKDQFSLEQQLATNIERLNKSQVLVQTLSDVTFDSGKFKKEIFSYLNSFGSVNQYVDNIDGVYYVNINGIRNKLQKIQKEYDIQYDKFQSKIQDLMNAIIKNKSNGFGFEPTIKNIFAVICANADVYIKLLKDVHTKAFSVGKERKEIINKGGFSDETPNDENIYPWPQIKILTKKGSQRELVYPGIKSLRSKLQSDNARLWPEVEFIEEYEKVASKKVDNLADKEAGADNVKFTIEGNSESKNSIPISTLLNIGTTSPYYDKSMTNVLYEIYERGNAVSFYDYFANDILVEMAQIEFENLKNNLSEDETIISTLSSITGFTTQYSGSVVDQTLESMMIYNSPRDRYPYYLDNIDTTDYIKQTVNKPFVISQNVDPLEIQDKSSNYKILNSRVTNYTTPLYRDYIYPFNSDKYLSYLGPQYFNKNGNTKTYKVNNSDNMLFGVFKLDTSENRFITSAKNSSAWFKSTQIFDGVNNLQYGSENSNILNTPYFHNQLLYDFSNNQSNGRYAGSAYLLLNSIPFRDLQDRINLGSDIRMSHLFKELGATHYVPYHLLLKWGSIYHRYKKFIKDGVDILGGVVDNSNTTILPDYQTMFVGSETDSNKTNVYISGYEFNYYSGITTVGVYPFYEALYHQVINGYAHFDVNDSSTYENNRLNNLIYSTQKDKFGDGTKYYTSFVDNSMYNGNVDQYYTILPSYTTSVDTGLYSDINILEQTGFGIITNSSVIESPLSDIKFPAYDEYFVADNQNETPIDGTYQINGNYNLYGQYRKVIDLIGTFSPDILDYFERLFLSFASERENVEIPQKTFPDYIETKNDETSTQIVSYQNFQELLKDIVTVKKLDNDPVGDFNGIYNKIITRQASNLQDISFLIMSYNNLIKLTLGNPKEHDLNLFTNFVKGVGFLNKTYGEYDETQFDEKFIKLYCGEDVDGYYKRFFTQMNIGYDEDSVMLFRPLIYMYAGYVKAITNSLDIVKGYGDSYEDFSTYVTNKILSEYSMRRSVYFSTLTNKLQSLKYTKNDKKITLTDGYNDAVLKYQAYDYFKTFNDKWTAGNSIGQRSLIEEFIFLDKANRDIGNSAYISLNKLVSFEDSAEDKLSLYSALSKLLNGTDFDLRGMPAYVNFYGVDYNKGGRIRSSKKVAKDIFGTFLEVDYQESTPKILIQYVGTTSKHPSDMPTKEEYLFKDDGFDISDPNNNPLRVTIPDFYNPNQLNQSNRVVGFEVNVGDQNQSMFKGVTLDQESLKNTSEFFHVLEGLSRSETGAATYAVDTQLFDLYRLRSYTCDVTSMGNVMIQPTMYFYLKNIPMFRGTYWITDVTHEIRPNNIVTKFKGVRMNKAALPDPQDSFISSYRIYFETILSKAIAKQAATTPAATTEKSVSTKSKSATVDMGTKDKPIQGESAVSDIGIDNFFGVPYNGYNGEKYIQKILYKGKTYYKAPAVLMGGNTYALSDNIEMSLYNKYNDITISGGAKAGKILWGDIKNSSSKLKFYSARFIPTDGNVVQNIYNNLRDAKTTFINPNKNDLTEVIEPVVYGIYPNVTPSGVNGAINVGPANLKYGIGLSSYLMKKLKLSEGDIVYFSLE